MHVILLIILQISSTSGLLASKCSSLLVLSRWWHSSCKELVGVAAFAHARDSRGVLWLKSSVTDHDGLFRSFRIDLRLPRYLWSDAIIWQRRYRLATWSRILLQDMPRRDRGLHGIEVVAIVFIRELSKRAGFELVLVIGLKSNWPFSLYYLLFY